MCWAKRLTLNTGELFVPDFVHVDSRSNVVVWFLGASWCASEQVFHDCHKNAALLVVNGKTLGHGFPESQNFSDLLDEVAGALKSAGMTDEGIGRIAIVSFSGGWTGSYSVLQHADLAKQVDNVVLLDSLYAWNKKEAKIDEPTIKPFLDFARRASEGDATFVNFTAQLYPPEAKYRSNTTSVCATYLIDHLGLDRKDTTGTPTHTPASKSTFYRAEKGNARTSSATRA